MLLGIPFMILLPRVKAWGMALGKPSWSVRKVLPFSSLDKTPSGCYA